VSARQDNASQLLDEVLGQLDQAIENRPREPAGDVLRDGIDRQREGLGRSTKVRSVRRSPAARRFQQELEEQSLTVGAAVGFLRLLRRVLKWL